MLFIKTEKQKQPKIHAVEKLGYIQVSESAMKKNYRYLQHD